MADFQKFKITRNGTTSLPNAPTWKIEVVVTDSQNGKVLADRTGVNAINFPQVLGQLTSTQQDELVEQIVNWLIRKHTGID